MPKKIYGVIYKITNIIDGKVYIGQTTDKKGFKGRYHGRGYGIEKMYNHYKSRKKYSRNYNVHLYNAIEKYGFNNFKVYENWDRAGSKSELDKKEKLWIKHYDSAVNGYNSDLGGENNKHTEEIKRKISNSEKGKKGKPCSDEVKQYLSKLFKNRVSPTKGMIMSNETRLKISNAHKGKHEGRSNPMYGKKGIDCPNSKKVICITTGMAFNSITEASEYYKCSKCGIGDCCMGIQRSSGRLEDGTKLVWMYYEEYIKCDNMNPSY